jgi:phosphate transport system permease protein
VGGATAQTGGLISAVTPRPVHNERTTGDRIYRAGATAAALLTTVVLTLIGWFLFKKGLPELRADGLSFFTSSKWTSIGPFGIAAVAYWTVIIAAIALVIALPVSIALAIFTTEYAPRRTRRAITSLIDLLAAIPSIIIGFWGLVFLQPKLVPIARWLTTHLSFLPLFATKSSNYESSGFVAGAVVALMIVPIITSVVREVMSQTPSGEKEAALALGSTRWDMIREVVLPFARGGIIGGSMLGLGRALGETVAVYLIISPTFVITPRVLESGANSISALIALRLGDAHGIAINALMAAGFTLFVITLLVNIVSAIVVRRSRSGAGVEL